MKPYSSYKEHLAEQELLRPKYVPAVTNTNLATQIPLALPARTYHTETTKSISPLPKSNFEFAKEVRNELKKLDDGFEPLKTFSQREMNEYLFRQDVYDDAVEKIQSNCSHSSVRFGTKRMDGGGGWLVGDICDICEKLVNPFKNPSTRDSMKSS